ncbi:SGNH/GDSL hydrolase family protein [Neolewinella agarilytica]|uniref:Lysophospholipase L1 n=1 Tax=Neolewinella agarilytica TaxID=478744 RepID=A0A1H8YZ91_9BACT|nr:SGNH/GDSL hydrolase family protein [Neolewinella agarilytica]SEP57412.1 Lysophospholipase L1 [Neolewinella agarilytica]
MYIRYLLGLMAAIPTLPIMYWHGQKILASVPKLPDATGPQGVTGEGKPFRLLAIGESTFAGVGVETQEEGFTAALAQVLAEELKSSVRWKIYARSGYTAARLNEEVLPQITETAADLIVIGTAGNDAFKLTQPWNFRKDVAYMIAFLQARFPGTPIAFANIPPIKEFPAFTPLIKWTIGNLVEWHGKEIRKLTKKYPTVVFNDEIIRLKPWAKELNLDEDPTAFFSDGVHPSGLTYQVWGKNFGEFVLGSGALDWE